MNRVLELIKGIVLYISLLFIKKSNIHAKYSTGDKVYFIMHGKIMCARISKIFIEIGGKDIIEYRVLPDDSLREQSTLFKESKLFSSKEELVKSL